MSQQNASEHGRIINSQVYFEIQLGDTELRIPISLVTLVGAALMIFAFVAMPWVQLLISFTGLDLVLESIKSVSSSAQYGYSIPFMTQLEIYSIFLIPIVALLCGIRSFRLLAGQTDSYKAVWRMAISVGVIALIPFGLLYTDLLNSIFGRYLLQNGFWFSLLGCIVVIGSSIAGLSRAST